MQTAPTAETQPASAAAAQNRPGSSNHKNKYLLFKIEEQCKTRKMN
ncbi:hypothetical protein [Methanimicrococcus hongohii]|nr:hypothetical protein [Methanimicrococcus sp. Hf6]